jgi:hypothetical protein
MVFVQGWRGQMPQKYGEPPGSRAAQYRAKAAETRAQAQTVIDDLARHMMIEAADTWDRLAAGLERQRPQHGPFREE